GLTVDPAGNIVVADTWNNRVQVFDHSGRLITLFGNQGTGPGELEYPNDILIVPLNSIPDPPPEG
ncbi:MAG: 6-bladed beta-propeller, partial [bacterium]|nr:6-bladed beta-propeller [bacterium]